MMFRVDDQLTTRNRYEVETLQYVLTVREKATTVPVWDGGC